MAVGSVGIVTINNNQGEFKEVERTFLFLGSAGAGAKSGLISVGAGSDLDSLFGAEESNLKTQIAAAVANAADSNFFAYAVALGNAETWSAAALAALEKPNDLNVEAIAVCDPVSAASAVTGAQSVAMNILSSFAKFVTIHLAVTGITAGETWAEYLTRVKAVVAGVAADRVSVTPLLHGNNLGAVCGRMCNPASSIADTPMRVATGAVIDLGGAPTDSAGAVLDMPTIRALSEARFSVPQWYPGYDGIFWADHPLLDAEGGDFQVVEYRRILDYIARRVRIRAIQRIGDRRLNSTRSSIAQNKTYFAAPIRAAAQSVIQGGHEYPGMVESPDDNCVGIVWTSKTNVSISITAKPFNCPKKITVFLGLDLSNE